MWVWGIRNVGVSKQWGRWTEDVWRQPILKVTSIPDYLQLKKTRGYRIILQDTVLLQIYRVIKKDGINWRVNGASTHARQLVAVFQVLCLLYGLPCVGYAQNSLQIVSHSPLIHVVGRNFCLYTDSLFAQTGDSNDKCSSSLEIECWIEDETRAAQQSPTEF